MPHADLASLDPVWTTADVTRNFSLAVYDTLYGYDAQFKAQPQMVEGHTVDDDGKQWELRLRDGLKFHDGTPVLARDCVATIRRWAKRYPMGQALMARTDELSAVSDKIIRFRLKRPFPLLPEALAEPYCSIMPERLAEDRRLRADQGSGRVRAIQIRRLRAGAGPARRLREEPGLHPARERRTELQRRSQGGSCRPCGLEFRAGSRPPPRWRSAQGEVDWWENPTIDLVPQLKRNKDLVITVKDRTGRIGCLRFNQLFPPFDNAAIRRVVLSAIDQKRSDDCGRRGRARA